MGLVPERKRRGMNSSHENDGGENEVIEVTLYIAREATCFVTLAKVHTRYCGKIKPLLICNYSPVHLQ